RSPSDRIRITWRRVGALTCFRRIDARRACWRRWSGAFAALVLPPDAFGEGAFTLVLIAAIRDEPPAPRRRRPGRTGTRRPRSRASGTIVARPGLTQSRSKG